MLGEIDQYGFMNGDQSEQIQFSKDLIEIIMIVTETRINVEPLRNDPERTMRFILEMREL